ncbi:MAG: nucleotidyltransferase family protein [Gemmatimonadota bacterium]
MKVGGIVLAAGRSSRMGASKALLEIGGETFLERAIGILLEGGCETVAVVLAVGEGSGRPGKLAHARGARPVENPIEGAEQIDSLRLGLEALPEDADAAIALPVDHPLANAGTVAALIRTFRSSGAPIVRPVYHDHPGHPVLFAREVWAELADPDLVEGAREVVHRHAEEIRDVAIDDRGVTVDVDTPEDYEREVTR